MFSTRLTTIMLAAARRPLAMVALAAVLVIVALAYTAHAFKMTTDTGELISATSAYRRNELRMGRTFPQLRNALTVVVDGATPELAEDAAARLAAAMTADGRHFRRVQRLDGGEFFGREGLLFASLESVRQTTQALIAAQPLLGTLAADPSLRGVAQAIDTAATGAASTGDTDTARLVTPLRQLAQSIDARMAGRPVQFSWQRLIATGHETAAPPTRRIIQAQALLDYTNLEPGSADVAAVHGQAEALHLDPAHGVTIGITGEVPIDDEEFGSLRENFGFVGMLMATAMLVVLWFATRSWRMVAAILITIIGGLAVTLAVGLLAVGRLNLISVAFIPLFVGLGVDFGIQIAVRFNEERRAGAAILPALEQVAMAIGEPLLMAAAAIFLALGAFLPTAYVGIAELGVIAGLGMIIAFALNITLLPALLVLLHPPVPAQDVGWAAAAPLDRWLQRRRRLVLGCFAGAMAVSIAGLHWVRFDFNPLHLQDPRAPAMRTLANLLRDPDRTPNTISVLAPNLATADRLAQRLSQLPEVAQAATLTSFIPADQDAKLALIQDASLLLDPAINPLDLSPTPDDAATTAELTKAAASLHALASARPGALGTAAARLSATFTRLAAASAAARRDAQAMLVEPLNISLNAIRTSLQASAVSRATLPPELAANWVAKDGQALVQVTPSGNSLDNAVLQRFTAAVLAIAPNASGLPVGTQAAARLIAGAFVTAGVLALVLVSVLLYAVLRSLREVAFTLAPVVLSGFLTLGTCVVVGLPLNFANIIAFPLLFGVGVAFHIYFVMAWRRGVANLLETSLARAVVFSALATGSAFGALWFSHHPGTASMGLILMISLIWTLVCALIFEPALLGPVNQNRAC